MHHQCKCLSSCALGIYAMCLDNMARRYHSSCNMLSMGGPHASAAAICAGLPPGMCAGAALPCAASVTVNAMCLQCQEHGVSKSAQHGLRLCRCALYGAAVVICCCMCLQAPDDRRAGSAQETAELGHLRTPQLKQRSVWRDSCSACSSMPCADRGASGSTPHLTLFTKEVTRVLSAGRMPSS